VSSNPVSYSTGATIIGPNTPNTEQIDPSRILTQANPNQPAYTENVPNSATPININLSGTQSMPLGSKTATTATAYYVFGDLTLANTSVLHIKGPVIIVVYGNVSIADTARIAVASTNPTTGGGPNVSLELHVAYGNMSIGGDGIANNTQSPERLLVMSTWNQGGTLAMSTSTPFYGVMDFPNNSLSIMNIQKIYRPLVAPSLTFYGSPAIPYALH